MFQVKRKGVYVSHLSLLYGSLGKERRGELATKVNEGMSLIDSVEIGGNCSG